jgi:vacuolar protein sorting-associated protein 18
MWDVLCVQDGEGSEGFHEPEEVELEEEIQFKLDDLRFDKTTRHGGIQQVVAANDVLLIASHKGRFFFFDLQSQSTTMFDVPRKGDEETHRVFLDPSGQHALIFMTNGEGHFFQASAAKPKKLDKIRGKERGSDKLVNVVVNSVGFDRRLKNYGVGAGQVAGSGSQSSSFSVGILLGSDDGRIFEAKMTPDGLKTVHQVYDFYERVKDDSPITGVQFELFGEEPGAIRQMHIMVATPNRLYRLIGGPSFEEVFSGYMQPPPFNELPLALKDAPMHFFARSTTQLPVRFGWMTTAGIYHGNLKYPSMTTVPADAVTVDVDLLPYERDRPASFLLSEFHFFVLFPDRLQIYLHPSGKIPREDRESKNRKLVFEVVFEKETQTGTPIGLAHDVSLNTYWLYTDRKIFEVVVQDETRDLWKLFLDRAKKFPEYFNLALKYCMENTEHEDRVLSEKAEYFFKEGDFVRSARVFATTSRPFEEIALRFVKTQDKTALRTFLLEKLRNYRPQDAMQRNCLCTWLTEIYLNHIDDLSKTGDEDVKQGISEEFEDFLTEYKVDLNKEATFRLISSHGLVRHMVFYAHLIQDFEKVVSHYVTRKDWESALSVLEAKCRAADYAELFYKFTPILLDAEPERTVRVLLSVHSIINPAMLLPAILQGPVEEGIRFLYYFIFVDRCEDEAVHNGLLNLYVKANDDAKLHSFLTYQDAKYDKRYALNLCLGSNKVNACVYLYGAMGLYEEAVDVALRNGNVKLARVSADRVEGDDERRKQLWMSIARHVVEHQKESTLQTNIISPLSLDCSLPSRFQHFATNRRLISCCLHDTIFHLLSYEHIAVTFCLFPFLKRGLKR